MQVVCDDDWPDVDRGNLLACRGAGWARQAGRQGPDGYGLATCSANGSVCVEKRHAARDEGLRFARTAREHEASSFVAHLRYSSSGDRSPANTHPFEQKHRVFAHNGHVGEGPGLDSRLVGHRWMVRGETDSERFFALITSEIDSWGGDIGEGIIAAVHWMPVSSRCSRSTS